MVASQQIVYQDLTGRPAHILEINTEITERKKCRAGTAGEPSAVRGHCRLGDDAIISSTKLSG